MLLDVQQFFGYQQLRILLSYSSLSVGVTLPKVTVNVVSVRQAVGLCVLSAGLWSRGGPLLFSLALCLLLCPFPGATDNTRRKQHPFDSPVG